MNTWTAIGVMSGTSVDGLDIVAVEFTNINQIWKYKVIKAISADYPAELRHRLINCIHSSAEELVFLDLELGRFIGKCVANFMQSLDHKIDLIASHGHTVFHQPEKGMTKQIGDGQSILNLTGILTINDFRLMDVINGGQGAPLVPIGDKYLFPDFKVCLNIGGFANISFDAQDGDRMAFDTGPANILLNHLARKMGLDYDSNGDIGRKGKLIKDLYNNLNALKYYKMPPPKSLGLEWVKENIISILDLPKYKTEDLMHTCVQHIAFQTNQAILKEAKRFVNTSGKINILVTGGGAYNLFLMENLRKAHDQLDYVIPQKETIDFKEAIIFAFLGILRMNKQANVLKSVTGAEKDSIGGTIHDNF